MLARLETRPAGLDVAEQARRLGTTGPNRLPDKPPRSPWVVLISQLKGFLNLLLLVAAAIAWAVGDLKDALMIGAVTVFNAILGFVQEHRAERALTALKHMVAFRARVRRGSQVVELAAEDLVPGDIALLEAGDRVPADGRLFAQRWQMRSVNGRASSFVSIIVRCSSPAPGGHLNRGSRHGL